MGYGDIKKEIEKKMGHEPSLMCSAHGCPQRWSVDPGHLCSYHAWEDPKHWPRITEDLHRLGPFELFHVKPFDTTTYPGDPRAWAKRLRDRDQAGDHISPLQRSMYQSALRLELEAA